MTDIVIRPTGAVVDLTGPTDLLGRALHEIREWEWQLRDAKREITGEVLRRMDERARWTVRAGDVTLKGQSPDSVEYDADALLAALQALAADGVIAQEAVAEAVEQVVMLKVRTRGVQALRKLGGPVREAVDGCARPSGRDRRVQVTVHE